MKKDFLTPQAAANELTRLALQKADNSPLIDGTFEQALRDFLLPKS